MPKIVDESVDEVLARPSKKKRSRRAKNSSDEYSERWLKRYRKQKRTEYEEDFLDYESDSDPEFS